MNVDITNSISRRKFISFLYTCFTCASYSIEAGHCQKNDSLNSHFYWLDLKSAIIYLPDAKIECGQPGSLMKLVAATAILEQNFPSATRTFDCRGSIIVNGQKYICRFPHGRVCLVEALGQSCNCFFANSAKELSTDCMLHYLMKYGLINSGSRSDLAKYRSNSAPIILGIADNLLFNAQQILQMIALIAKRGDLPVLHLLNSKASIIINNPNFAAHTWDVLQSGMEIACRIGTAKNLDPQNKLHIACKTGTTVHGKSFQSWLAGYFPRESPRYIFCFRAQSGTSYDRAVPLAKKILFSRSWNK